MLRLATSEVENDQEKTEGGLSRLLDSQGISARLVILGATQPTVTAPSDSGCSDCARDMLDMCGVTTRQQLNWPKLTSNDLLIAADQHSMKDWDAKNHLRLNIAPRNTGEFT